MNPSQNQNPATPAPTPPRQNKKRLILVVVGLVVLALVATIAWWYGQNQAEVAAQQEDGPTVSITPTGYSPATIKIKAGQEVTWTNNSDDTHRLKADTTTLPGFDSIEALNNGDSYTYSFDTAGTYRYYDLANPTELSGTVIVEQ